jgi:hypothetical protein
MSRAEQIDMVRRHVADGERHVAAQLDIIERLRELGADTDLAEDLLEEFEAALAQHQVHLAQLLSA